MWTQWWQHLATSFQTSFFLVDDIDCNCLKLTLHSFQVVVDCCATNLQQIRTSGVWASVFLTVNKHSGAGKHRVPMWQASCNYWPFYGSLSHWLIMTFVARVYMHCTDLTLTLSPPIPSMLYTSPYWSNPPFLIFDIRALWRSVLSARVPECQKLKMVG